MNIEFQPLEFSSLGGWQDEDHLAAFNCFLNSARRIAKKPYTTKTIGIDALALAKISQTAMELKNPGLPEARQFFESSFQPHRVANFDDTKPDSSYQGFVTGYYEPEISASLTKTDKFKYPILRRPDDLVNIDDQTRPGEMDPSFFFAREEINEAGRSLSPYYDRGEIEQGALNDRGLELFWFESRVDIFFIHIQGSARLVMPDGQARRISYSAKSGHEFTAIGKLLIERGALTRENVTMQSIRKWLHDHPSQADALMRENRSYIFFQEIDHPMPELGPVAAAGVPLTPGRSLAIDHRLHTFGTPFWIETEQPLPGFAKKMQRIMIAQDTGSAIVGPARGDLFIGTGLGAGEIAGAVKHAADFVMLVPS